MAAAADKKQRGLAPKAVLGAVIAGIVACAAVIVAVSFALPAQGEVDAAEEYGYVYSGAKSSSVDFAMAGADEDTVLLFGSSELSTSSELVAQVPSEVFGKRDYGIDLMCVGEAFDQSLWQTMAAAAYAPASQSKKATLIVSPAWFEDDGLDAESFKTRFSYSLYRAFCDNPDVSDASKAYVAQRLLDMGIDATTVEAGKRELPQDYLNDAVFSAMDDLKLRNELQEVRGAGLDAGEKEAAVDFEELETQAYLDGEAACTTNDWGIDDAYWEQNFEGRLDALEGNVADETFSNADEYADFAVLLEVMKEVGFEPLIIISPLHGEVYDLLGADIETREACYERIRSACEAAGVEVADFSDREYEQYFLHDIVHFGWTGWVAVEEAVYGYANER